MKKLIVLAATSVVALMFSGQASAELIGACLTPGGDLSDVTVGSVPQCGGNKTPIGWNVVGPVGPEGPQGEPGATGAVGPAGPAGGVSVGTHQLTKSAGTTNGDISSVEWNNECEALSGRAATTRDLLTLPWDPLALAPGTDPSWVRPFIVGVEGSDLIDITGARGPLATLACAFGLLGFSWSIDSSFTRGLVAVNGSALPEFCSETLPVTCVVPVP